MNTSWNEEKYLRFSEWLRAKREALKLTQQQTAQRLQMSLSYYNAVENQKKMPKFKTVFRMAHLLGDTSILKELFGVAVLDDAMPSVPSMPALDADTVGAFEHPYAGWLQQLMTAEAVPGSDQLWAWGIRETHIVFLRTATLRELHDQELFYVRSTSMRKGQFVFAEVKDPAQVYALQPSLVYAQRVGVAFRELRVNAVTEDAPSFLVNTQDYEIYKIIGILQERPPTAMRPSPLLHDHLKSDSYQLLARQFLYMSDRDAQLELPLT